MEENKKTFRKELEELINRQVGGSPRFRTKDVMEYIESSATVDGRPAGIRSIQEKKDVPAPSGEAIERAKTTAAHVRFDGPDGTEFYLCTRCGYNGLSPASHFCPNCGREINWGGACADSPAGENLS